MGDLRLFARAWKDPRFASLGRALRINRAEALLLCGQVWLECQRRGVDRLPSLAVSAITEHHGFAKSMVTAGLAESLPDGLVRVKGTRERHDWLKAQQYKAKLGGLAVGIRSNPYESQIAQITSCNNSDHGTPSGVFTSETQIAHLSIGYSSLQASPTQGVSATPQSAQIGVLSVESYSLQASPKLVNSGNGKNGTQQNAPGQALILSSTTPAEEKKRRAEAKRVAAAVTLNDKARLVCREWLDYFSARTGGKPGALAVTDPRYKAIKRVLSEGYNLHDLKVVVWSKVNGPRKWLGDEQMDRHLVPDTLLRPTHFAKYLEQARTEYCKFNPAKARELGWWEQYGEEGRY